VSIKRKSEKVTRTRPEEAAYSRARLGIKSNTEKEAIYRISDASLKTYKEKIAAIRAGVSKNDLMWLKGEVELDYDELTDLLAVSRATLINKKGKQKFNQPTSERILLLKDLVDYGVAIFGDSVILREWLKTPSEALGNVTPLSIMDTVYGIEEVKKELGRIAYGVY
jgi:putative toxin-antitoxin system antitoxin component (TIGR02293 family)